MLPYFIKTIDNIIWFAINRVNDKYLCIPKYLKSYKGKSYVEWYSNDISIELEKYYKKLDGLGEFVFLVGANDIIEKYDPLQFLNEIHQYKLKYNFEYYVLTLVKYISEFFEIKKEHIGIEGSLLLNKYYKNSDIDILIYGKENSKKIQHKFLDFNNYNGEVNLFDEKTAAKYMEERFDCGFGNNLEVAQKQFLRRYYGFISNKQFSIVCVPYENKSGYIDLNRNLKYLGQFEDVLKIVNADNSCVVPSTYIGMNKKGIEYTIEVYNHYGINQLKTNEKAYISGNLYLNEKTGEKIIIIAFWNKNRGRMDLYE